MQYYFLLTQLLTEDSTLKWPMRGLALIDLGTIVIEIGGERYLLGAFLVDLPSGSTCLGLDEIHECLVADIAIVSAVARLSAVPHYHGSQNERKIFNPTTSVFGMLRTIQPALHPAIDPPESFSRPAAR
jgi:hypothetical protein